MYAFFIVGFIVGMTFAVIADIKKNKPFEKSEDIVAGFDLSVFDEAVKNISPTHGLIREF